MTGTPPNKMRFTLQAEIGAMKIKIPYPNAGAYTVYLKGSEIPYTPWDEALGRHGELSKTQGCGENRFVGIENFLEFYLTSECTVTIAPRDAIMTSVRMEWTLDEFYADGGVVSFADRVAAALGIHASTVKIVAVYEGSVIVDFFVEVEEEEEEDQTRVKKERIQRDLYNQLNNGQIGLGAPILGALTGGKVIAPSSKNDIVVSNNFQEEVGEFQ